MVSSITFPETTSESDGYLNKIEYKNVLKKGKTEEDAKKLLEAYRAEAGLTFKDRKLRYKYRSETHLLESFYTLKKCGFTNKAARTNLMGKTIEFEKDRINLIFGPNGSGKSTVLRAIAGNCMCGGGSNQGNLDGFSSPYFCTKNNSLSFLSFGESYSDIYRYDKDKDKIVINDKESYNNFKKNFQKNLHQHAGNKSTVAWDGTPVYYENFSGRRSFGVLEDFQGSIIGNNAADAICYLMDRNSVSLGQHGLFLISRLFQISENVPDLKAEILKIEEQLLLRLKESRETYFNDYAVYYQSQHLKKLLLTQDATNTVSATYLLDEIDKSLDILTVTELYRDILPKFRKERNAQIIAISHNPLVLSSLLKPEEYNIISLDNKYTEKVKKTLNKVTF